MREPPAEVGEDDVAAALRTGWGLAVGRLTHLPVGFGAHHWALDTHDTRTHFVTYDRCGTRHDLASLAAAYAVAARLDLDFVLAPIPTLGGSPVVPLGRGALSVTPWTSAAAASGVFSEADAAGTADLLAVLHEAPVDMDAPPWRPLVAEDLADALALRVGLPWRSGPMAARAHDALVTHLPRIAGWTARYHALAARTDPSTWVLTHGEPGGHNQLLTTRGRVLIDWESLKRAPRERDFASLLSSGTGWCASYGLTIGASPGWRPDPALVELFDLEWRLDEISQYADWFEAPHTGTESDRIALGGLLGELTRAEWRPSG